MYYFIGNAEQLGRTYPEFFNAEGAEEYAQRAQRNAITLRALNERVLHRGAFL
jgi:hypothetical protein